jgi:transketolase
MTNRERLIDISYRHHLSHIGSCLTALPIIENIYAIKRPEEKFILSSGHAHLAHLVVLEQNGKVKAEETLEKYGIHCDRRAGCDVSTGSLGQGLPIAVGMAIADRSKNVYCLISDGEAAEGSIWESLRVARQLQLDNLKVYCNANGWSAYDGVDVDDLEKRFKSFGFPIEVIRTNSDIGTWAIGLQSHYKVVDDKII